MGEGEREGRVPDQDGARRAAAHRHRADGKAEQRARDLHLDDVAAFAPPFDQELRVASLSRSEREHIVGRAERAVRSRLHDGLNPRDLAAVGPPHAQRIVGRSDDRVDAGRQDDLRLEVGDDEIRARGGDVADHQHHAEELIEEPDVARNHDDAWDRRHEEVLSVDLWNLERESLDVEVRDLRLQPLEAVWNHRLQARQARLRSDAGQPHFARRYVLRPLQGREDDGEVDRNLPVLDRERGGEVVGLEAGLVEDQTLLPDLGCGQRPGRDFRDEQAVDDVDDGALRRAAQDDLTVADQADVVERVPARHRQRRDVERRVRLDDQFERRRERRAAQRRHDDRVRRERRQVAGHLRGHEHRADDRGDVLRDGLLRGLDLETETEEEDVFLRQEAAVLNLSAPRGVDHIDPRGHRHREHGRQRERPRDDACSRRDPPPNARACGSAHGFGFLIVAGLRVKSVTAPVSNPSGARAMASSPTPVANPSAA